MGWLGGLAGLAGGGLLSSAGDVLGDSFAKLLGGESASDIANRNTQEGIQAGLSAINPMMQQSRYNAAGQIGEQAQQGFQRQYGQYANTIDPRTQSLGNTAMSSANRGYSDAMTQAGVAQRGMQQGQQQMRNQLMNSEPGNIAQKVASMQQFGQGNAVGANQMLGTSAEALGNANRNIAATAGNVSNMYQNSMKNRFDMNVAPWQVNMQNNAGMVNGLAGISSGNQQFSREYDSTNPLAGLSWGLGNIGGANLGKYIDTV